MCDVFYLCRDCPFLTVTSFLGQVTTVQVPFLFKTIVDSLNVEMTASTTVWMVGGFSIVGCEFEDISTIPSLTLLAGWLIDGFTRVCGTLFSEMRNAVFASVAQRAVRKVARDTFDHLLSLDLKFHLERQTGGLTRAIDRGTKSINLFPFERTSY